MCAQNGLKLGCVVMAAGNATRFGGNKLTSLLDGRSLIRRSLEAIPPSLFEQVVVVTQYPDIAILAKEFRFTVIFNEHPESGISGTIQLGLTQLRGCGGVMFQVSDQPFLRQETVARLAALWHPNPDSIAALSHNGQRGNPCIFPARFFPELMNLSGDQGGSAVIRRHPEALTLLEREAVQLADVDTRAALEQLKSQLP